MKRIITMVVIAMVSLTVCTGGKNINNDNIEKAYAYNDDKIKYYGRTLEDTENKMRYFNWTCSGFEFKFYGKKAEAEILTQTMMVRGEGLSPWVMVLVDGSEEPYKLIELKEGNQKYTLFESDVAGEHTIKVLKRTEAGHSKNALSAINITGNGGLIKLDQNEKYKIEFIGDSITCGYGNEASKIEDPFKPHQENGWEAFAAKTAKYLQADFNCVSISGIGVYSNYTDSNNRITNLTMPQIYQYADAYLEEWQGKKTYTPWDFESYKPNLIVINLGTNDLSYINYDKKNRVNVFNEYYSNFIKQVRALNGKDVKILCTILDNNIDKGILIENAVKAYKQETKDPNIETLIFKSPLPEDGIGSQSHPTIKTHEKMAQQLTDKIRAWLGW